MRIRQDRNPDFAPGIQSAVLVRAVEQFDSKRPKDVEGPQDTNRDGVPLWLIHCMFADEEADFLNPEPFAVKVASAKMPEIPKGGCFVVFGGVYQNINPRRNGGFSVSYTAETFTFDPAPSTKRAKADVPPAPAAPAGARK